MGVLDSVLLCQALLRKIIAKLGGPFSAAKQLGLSPWTLHRFLRGAAPMPDDVFQRAMNIVREESPAVYRSRNPPPSVRT